MSKFNLFSAIFIIVASCWSFIKGDMMMALIEVGLLCALLLSAILLELADLKKCLKR